jgi:hypothetical protein
MAAGIVGEGGDCGQSEGLLKPCQTDPDDHGGGCHESRIMAIRSSCRFHPKPTLCPIRSHFMRSLRVAPTPFIRRCLRWVRERGPARRRRAAASAAC